MTANVMFTEITRIDDDLLPDWLDLYEISFPPEERVLVSDFLRLAKDKAKGQRPDSHMIAGMDESDRLIAIARYDAIAEERIGCFWYLAVRPDSRSGGIGSKCFEEVAARCEEAGMRALMLEVEMPDEQSDPERRDLSRRRIEFYRRHGARLLTGIHYIQSVGPHQPEIPMHIMLRPFEPLTPEEALEIAELFFDSITQVGELGLE